MEEGKQAVSFSFRQTQMNTLLHLQPTQAVSSFHGVILPWNQRTLCSLHPAEKTNAALPMDCKGGKEGGRERELCAFPASPSLQLCAVSRCKVTLSSYMCGLKDYKTERKWMVPFFFSSCIWNSFLSFLGAPSVDWWTTGQRRRKGFLPANPRVQDVLFLLQQLMTP